MVALTLVLGPVVHERFLHRRKKKREVTKSDTMHETQRLITQGNKKVLGGLPVFT